MAIIKKPCSCMFRPAQTGAHMQTHAHTHRHAARVVGSGQRTRTCKYGARLCVGGRYGVALAGGVVRRRWQLMRCGDAGGPVAYGRAHPSAVRPRSIRGGLPGNHRNQTSQPDVIIRRHDQASHPSVAIKRRNQASEPGTHRGLHKVHPGIPSVPQKKAWHRSQQSPPSATRGCRSSRPRPGLVRAWRCR